MSNKESEDSSTTKEVIEKPATSEIFTTTASKDKNFLGLNFNDVWTLGATALVATGLGATIGYFLSPAIRQWVDNIRQTATAMPPGPPPATATVPNLTPEELSKKYYADKIRQQQKEEQQFYDSLKQQPNVVKKKHRTPEASNYYDQYENDIPIIDDNDIFSKVSKRKFPQQEESFFKIRDEELHPFQKQQQQKEEEQQQQQQKPMFNVESKKIPEEELSIYTDDKIDINKLPPEFTNVGNRETSPTKDNDDYDITNLEMTEEELNNLAKNNNSG